MTFVSFDPSSGRVLAHHACLSETELEHRLSRAFQTTQAWQQTFSLIVQAGIHTIGKT